MDYSNYVKFILRKWALSIALQILKMKPNDISTREFCKSLQIKLSSVNISSNTEEIGDTQLSIANDLIQFQNDTQIVNESNPSSSRFLQEFMDMRITRVEQNSNSFLSFEVLNAVNFVKKKICSINGSLTFDNMDVDSSNVFDRKDDSQNMSQDSGYPWSQLSNNCRNEPDLSQLNSTLNIIIKFLVENCNESIDMSMVNYTSSIFGRAIDVLWEHNIYLNSFDNVTDVIEDYLRKVIHQSRNTEMKENQRKMFVSILFHKSLFLIEHSLMYLTNELQNLMDKISSYGDTKAIEFEDPKLTHGAYYIFFLFEGLLKSKVEFKHNKNISQNSQLDDSAATQTSIKNKLFQKRSIKRNNVAREKYLKLLNDAMITCVDTYPLIAFWAMTCINIDNAMIK